MLHSFSEQVALVKKFLGFFDNVSFQRDRISTSSWHASCLDDDEQMLLVSIGCICEDERIKMWAENLLTFFVILA
jgi:hypothetical protein